MAMHTVLHDYCISRAKVKKHVPTDDSPPSNEHIRNLPEKIKQCFAFLLNPETVCRRSSIRWLSWHFINACTTQVWGSEPIAVVCTPTWASPQWAFGGSATACLLKGLPDPSPAHLSSYLNRRDYGGRWPSSWISGWTQNDRTASLEAVFFF